MSEARRDLPQASIEDLSNGTPQPQKVFRRSMRSNSDVRHGRIYDEPSDSVRLVTPESVPIEAGWATEISLSPQRIPQSNHSQVSGREPSASVSNTDEEGTDTPRQRRKALKKNKGRGEGTIDNLNSPGSFMSKTRTRLGSIHAKSSGQSRHDDSSTTTLHPLITNLVPPTHNAETRNSFPRGPRRTFSYETVSGSGTQSPHSPYPDSTKILNLMKTTCGRMHGILFFRPIGTSVWESGYCAINVAPGSLVCQKQGEVSSTKTLLSDLRGCSVRTNLDAETQNTFISVVLATEAGYQLRPPVPETFDSWLAALLCWQPLRSKGIHNKLMKTRSPTMIEKRPVSQRQFSDSSTPRSNAVVKIGRMLLWHGPIPPGSQRQLSRRQEDFDNLPSNSPWQRVSCALHENGMFRLLTEVNKQVVVSLRLSDLARCAIQRLDRSVLDAPDCIAIYPQYTSPAVAPKAVRPLIVGLESKSAFEAWFVLLRTMTAPELYGPEQYEPRSPISTDNESTRNASLTFRIERSLAVKIIEAKLHMAAAMDGLQARSMPTADLYADILFGRDVCARTAAKAASTNAFWAEEFSFPDLPPTLSSLSLAIKLANPAEQEWSMVSLGDDEPALTDATQMSTLNSIEVASHDPECGRMNIQVDDMEPDEAVEKWWPLCDKYGRSVGTILARFTLNETAVLMESEYTELSTLLHNFPNGLTVQIAQTLGQELKYISELLLDIFQASNKAQEWINMLVEDEIDGVNKETPPARIRFNGRVHSNDSVEQGPNREALVRDASRSATVEANLLFRGNSLVTKALDAHMRRLGKEYLEATVGAKLRHILSQNVDCEVDPSRVKYPDQLGKNWNNLKTLTDSVWQLIASSTSECPPALRVIFKHIRSCAEDRYGSFIRTVKYTSVSGFLFLRFFCPAILNPRLFGLIEDHPPERARRTFTLIAKSLNALASMVKFGTKETWMEPMNQFLQTATPEFKSFVDNVCSISSSHGNLVIEPQFLAPMQIRARMSKLSTEGLPILPYLLDAPRSTASLVEVWMKHASKKVFDPETDESLRTFHEHCLNLHRKTEECMSRAESAEKPDRNLAPQWQQMLSNQQKLGALKINPMENALQGDQDITALPQRESSKAYHIESNVFDKRFIGSLSPVDGRRLASAPSNMAFNTSTNSSTVSFDYVDEGRKTMGSREGLSKGRIFDYLNPTRKRSRAVPNERTNDDI